MTWLLRVAGALVLLAAVTVGVVHLFGEDIWQGVADTPAAVPFERLTPATASNEFLVCPENVCGREPDLVSPVYGVTPDRLLETLRTRLISRAGIPLTLDDGMLVYTTHSPVLRFPDDVSVRAFPAEDGGARIAIRGKARIGVDDFGANETRAREWLALIEDLERRPAS